MDRVAYISHARALTSAEKREIARQRRLVNNRESARRTRLIKKQQVEVLEEENIALRRRLIELEDQLQQQQQPPIQPQWHPLLREAPQPLSLFDYDASETLSF